MSGGVFVTGTDTDCGKTFVAEGLLRQLQSAGIVAAGFKPVAAGAEWRDGILQNDDALTLLAASGIALRYDEVNPYCFQPPIAPHLAAAQVKVAINNTRILSAAQALARRCEFVVVEGAGGWRVPLGKDSDMGSLARLLGYPVLLVVGMRLGCLNHALLTEQAVLDSGLALAGWIATQVDPSMPLLEENLSTLRERMHSPCRGFLPHHIAAPLDIDSYPIDVEGLLAS